MPDMTFTYTVSGSSALSAMLHRISSVFSEFCAACSIAHNDIMWGNLTNLQLSIRHFHLLKCRSDTEFVQAFLSQSNHFVRVLHFSRSHSADLGKPDGSSGLAIVGLGGVAALPAKKNKQVVDRAASLAFPPLFAVAIDLHSPI